MALATREQLLASFEQSSLTAQTRDNVQFSMSQELAQDEDDADAEDYEIDSLEHGRISHQPLSHDDEEDDHEEGKKMFQGSNGASRGEPRGEVRDESVVFAMGDDSDDDERRSEDSAGGGRGKVRDE